MSSRAKLAAILLLTFVCVIGAAWGALDSIVLRNFKALEAAQEDADAKRLRASLDAKLDDLAARESDYADWDDTVRFLRGEYPNFPQANFTPDWFANYQVDLALFADQNGDVIWARNRTGVGNTLETSALLNNVVLSDARAARPRVDKPASGFIWTQHGPLFYVARPAASSARAGTPTGLVVLGRYLSVDRLRRQTQLNLDFVDATSQSESLEVMDALHTLAISRAQQIDLSDRTGRQLLIPLRMANGQVIGAVRSRRPDALYERGRHLAFTAIAAFALALAAALSGLWLVFQRGLAKTHPTDVSLKRQDDQTLQS